MLTFFINLSDIDKVKSFCNNASKCNFDIDLVSGRYIIDAKSIMGIFSLDLSKKIQCNAHCREEEYNEFVESIKDCIVGDTIYND